MTSLANYIILEPLKPLNPKLTVAQLLHFEHFSVISFFFSIFQEMTEWEFHIPTGVYCATAGKGAFFGTLPPRLRGAEPPGGKKVRKNKSLHLHRRGRRLDVPSNASRHTVSL